MLSDFNDERAEVLPELNAAAMRGATAMAVSMSVEESTLVIDRVPVSSRFDHHHVQVRTRLSTQWYRPVVDARRDDMVSWPY